MPQVQQPTATLSVRSRAGRGGRSEHQIRDLPPVAIDAGQSCPSPLEFLLAALNACETILISMVANERQLAYDQVEIAAEADLDYRGMMGDPTVRPYFQSVRQTVRLATAASDEEIAELRREVERRCPVFTLLKAAGIPVQTEWSRA